MHTMGHFYKKLRVLRENISETNFPGVACLLVQETQDCIRYEKIFYQIHDPENALLPQWGHKNDTFTNA